jgi:hypothetical protein
MLTGSLVSSPQAQAGDRSGTTTRPLHDGSSYAASGFCAWGIQGRGGRKDGSGGWLHTAIPLEALRA